MKELFLALLFCVVLLGIVCLFIWLLNQIKKNTMNKLMKKELSDEIKLILRKAENRRFANENDILTLKQHTKSSFMIYLAIVIIAIGAIVIKIAINEDNLVAVIFVIPILLIVSALLFLLDKNKKNISTENATYVVIAYVFNISRSRYGKNLSIAFFDHYTGNISSASVSEEVGYSYNVQKGDMIRIIVTEKNGKLKFISVA